jgi:hypothetical protein
MALGFTIPLFIVMGALAIVALLLLGPRPLVRAPELSLHFRGASAPMICA